MLHQAGDQHGQIGALVVRRNHDQRRRVHPRGLSNLSEAICSDTRPMRNMITLSRISSTDELVTCDCVAMVQTAYAAPTVNVARLTGRKIRIGLKIVISFSRISTNFAPSDPRRMFDAPCRAAASIGTNCTL